jgi:predicted TPR repeat methyltransferase
VGARDRLRDLVDSSAALRYRVEALILIAESFTAQRDIARATDAYARADALAPRHPAGHNARFALARLLERRAGDEKAAAAAYRRYLDHAPDGALASQARQALCRLGSGHHCD